MKKIRLGYKVVGYMCMRTEPYPYGESECIPIFGPLEQLPEEKETKRQSLQDQIDKAVRAVKERVEEEK